MPREPDQPVVLSKWYSVVKWLLEKVDNFPKNQRFVFGTRLADRALTILETLVEASYAREGKAPLQDNCKSGLKGRDM